MVKENYAMKNEECFENLFRENLAAEVDVSDLTWEQKEQVLRELFIRMNMRKSSMTDSTTNAYVFGISSS